MTHLSLFTRASRLWVFLPAAALILWSLGPLHAQEPDLDPAPPAAEEVDAPAPPTEPVPGEAPPDEAEQEAAAAEEEEEDLGWFRESSARIVETAEKGATWTAGQMARVLFFDLAFGTLHREKLDPQTGEVVIDPETGEPVMLETELPLVVMTLMFGAVFFTFWFWFINLRGFRHGWQIIRGKFTKKTDVGEISPFRALTSALSATVGLGNIAGVAIAITMGGPGAMFWMVIIGFFGMSLKFTECTLGQMFRRTNPDGTIAGGPMFYLDAGMRELGPGFARLGKVLAVAFAFMVMIGSFGGGNMFQANQSFAILQDTLSDTRVAGMMDLEAAWVRVVFGLIAAFCVGIVVIGGIRRIGAVTARLIPFMAAIYVLACLTVLVWHYEKVPSAFATIISMAFTDNAVYGGIIGVFIIAVRRAAFSNEAGLGSSPIAHSAARNREPVREGLVGMMEPFIDTIIICTLTALVVVITDVYLQPDLDGIQLTRAAFLQVLPWFPYVLLVCVILFAYSTMIAWCYYGERGWIYLLDNFGTVGLGVRTLIIFRLAFVFFAFVGALVQLETLIDLMDLLILGMSFPNIIGCLILAPLLWKAVNSYWRRYEAGEFDREEEEDGEYPRA